MDFTIRKIYSLEFSPDRQTLATGHFDTIKIWNLESGTEIKKLKGHGYYFNSLVFSLDGMTLISGNDDNTIKIWDLHSGAQKK